MNDIQFTSNVCFIFEPRASWKTYRHKVHKVIAFSRALVTRFPPINAIEPAFKTGGNVSSIMKVPVSGTLLLIAAAVSAKEISRDRQWFNSYDYGTGDGYGYGTTDYGYGTGYGYGYNTGYGYGYYPGYGYVTCYVYGYGTGYGYGYYSGYGYG